jgi:iron complex outermembrane receptor protein
LGGIVKVDRKEERVNAARVWIAIVAALTALAANAQAGKPSDLVDLSLEELANLEITSVSRRAERLSDAPASIFVITGDDIRGSGATSLPEALRLAPNLEVARVDSRQYAISARGFNNTIANKLLVLIDGRTVYTPLFSGVFWDAQDTLLEDVDRIEVISGPGATLWGANAVNGVINVISRRAAETQGTLLVAGAGNLERGAAARQGGKAGVDGAFRVYGKISDRDHTSRADGTSVPDSWDSGQAGFRADWGTAVGAFTLQGDAYRGTIDQAASGDIRISGGNLLARWARQLSGGDRVQVQAYFDNTEREIPGTFAERLNTFDVEFQHALRVGSQHSVIWGGGYRRADDHVSNTAAIAFLPADRNLRRGNLFVQDEIALRGDQLRLTLGTKAQSNPYTATEFLPSARIAWKPDASRLVWSALSRAVRAPARLDRELFVSAQPPVLPQPIAGGPDFRSEISKVLELGYRAQPSRRASYSVTLFHSVHDHLRSLEPGPAGALVIGNEMEGKTDGIEAWGSLQAAERWRLSAGLLVLDQNLRLKAGSGDTSGVAAAGNDPKHQWNLRSSLDLPGRQEFDVMLRHVGPLPSPGVPGYTALDARYAWHFERGLELALIAQNLFDRSHPEFAAPPAPPSEIERGLFLKLRWSL